MAPYPASAAKPGEHFSANQPKTPYKYLTQEDVDHFLNHGWLRVPNAIDEDIIETWTADLWTRSGYDQNDKSTWALEYLHMPFHRQERYEKFAPTAFNKITEIIGGEDKWDDERERWVGDNFVTNFGSEERSKAEVEKTPKDKLGWHCDNDWYRQFLDSSGTALTVINCFSDVPLRGGGTWLCEDGLSGVCKRLYDHPEGLDPGSTANDLAHHVYDCDIFATMEAKKGDVFILHGLLPHVVSFNYLHFARPITNTHVTLKEPLNLARDDNQYSLVEQVILRGLDRSSVPEFKPTRERMYWYPRNYAFKEIRTEEEVRRLVAAAEAKGLTRDSVDSLWLRGPEAKEHFDRVNGFHLPVHQEVGFVYDQHPI